MKSNGTETLIELTSSIKSKKHQLLQEALISILFRTLT
jgi:hypothetical protein